MLKRFLLTLSAAVALTSVANAQTGFPNREIKLIVPFAAGGLPTATEYRI
jgi:tripartite-type tricarboxylate transporter receptor subunit TctC